MGEDFALVGTPAHLRYQSNRLRGLSAFFTTDITLIVGAPPAGLDLRHAAT